MLKGLQSKLRSFTNAQPKTEETPEDDSNLNSGTASPKDEDASSHDPNNNGPRHRASTVPSLLGQRYVASTSSPPSQPWSEAMDDRITDVVDSFFRKFSTIFDSSIRNIQPGDTVICVDNVSTLCQIPGEESQMKFGSLHIKCCLDKHNNKSLYLSWSPADSFGIPVDLLRSGNETPQEFISLDSGCPSSNQISTPSCSDNKEGTSDDPVPLSNGKSSSCLPQVENETPSSSDINGIAHESLPSKDVVGQDFIAEEKTTVANEVDTNALFWNVVKENGAENRPLLCDDVASRSNSIASTSLDELSICLQSAVFGMSLSRLRSVRVFFEPESEDEGDLRRGQLVLESREKQFKVFYLFFQDMKRVQQVFDSWPSVFKMKPHRKVIGLDRYFRVYEVIQRTSSDDQHPDEEDYPRITSDVWMSQLDPQGRIKDPNWVRKSVFHSGLDPSLRKEVWPYLLQAMPWDADDLQRDAIRCENQKRYSRLSAEREKVFSASTFRDIVYTVEKDVHRTDRLRPFYAGQGNANVEVLQEILLNLAVCHPSIGYTQGMSDLLSPLLEILGDRVETYVCFESLMQRTLFVATPKQSDIERHLTYLREMYRILTPQFYTYLESLEGNALDLLFSHRWLLLCFKRELPDHESLRLWEACWARCDTDYFHLFLCVALVALYADPVIEEDLPADEMLLFFASLANHVCAQDLLAKARSLLHQFRSLDTIPCTLSALCRLCGNGVWDSGHLPKVVCIGHPEGQTECNLDIP